MKNVLFLLLFCSTVNAADIVKHKAMTEYVAPFKAMHESMTPNKALVYFSNRDNPDLIGKQIVNIDSPDISDGILEITRPTSSIGNELPASVITGTVLSSCEADFGEVTITPTKLIVYTHTPKIIVKCQDATGANRWNFGTIYQP